MEEVKIKDLKPGKDYYIQLVGSYFTHNDYRESGKAIGINFQKTVTFRELIHDNMNNGLDLTLSLDSFKNDDLFAQFEKVVPVNPDTPHKCGICHYEYYPSILPSWDNLTDEQKEISRGGYQFFKIKKQETVQVMRNKIHETMSPTVLSSHVRKFLGGKTRRRRRKTKTKRRRKTNTKRRRKKI